MKIAAFLLSSNRKKFLHKALDSLREQKSEIEKIYFVKDFKSLNDLNTEDEKICVIEPPKQNIGKGWTYAFEYALSQVPEWADYFFVMHDDDVLSGDYVRKMRTAAGVHPYANVLSCSLGHISEEGYELDHQPFQFAQTHLQGRESVAFHYLNQCIPFPSCFYKNTKALRRLKVRHDLGSFADGLFLTQYVGNDSAVILSETLYKYRKHPSQVSFSPPKELEDLFYSCLKNEIENLKSKKLFGSRLFDRNFKKYYNQAKQQKNAVILLSWLIKHNAFYLTRKLCNAEKLIKTSKTFIRYCFE
jgi:glycosyltransferase involved in cell wall biosynthesis